MTEENLEKLNFMTLENAKKALEKNGFKAEIFKTKEEAADYIAALVGENKNVGFGGTVTGAQMKLAEKLAEKNNKIIVHLPQMSPEQKRETWFKAISADFYFASPQAVTLDGKLVFIDGTGNRCAAVTWGPRHIILPAGINKIVKDQEEGLWRMRNIAAIPNNLRLNKKNPCVKTGKCEDCASPERICNLVTMLWKKPKVTEYTVILVNESLGY
ncbi:MAG: lactate utilization protein C [Elusimicrobia bacterium CG08_land_8_20_14_0_20_51_18]|nr:MAG: lactate utilization protein C [Elusimicrobia bacterium CG08_land_8_20_14_0_20_51_18]